MNLSAEKLETIKCSKIFSNKSILETMKNYYRRREFIKTTAAASIGLGLSGNASPIFSNSNMAEGKRAGIIGLDTSHVTAFTQTLNSEKAGPEFGGYKVVAAFPTKGSADMPSSINRLAGFTEKLRGMGVEIVDTEEELLKRVDVVFLESVDGRPHLELALPVLKAGKRMFIDKPISNSLAGAMAIFEASRKYNVPVFSSSATRFAPAARDIVEGRTKVEKVLGADTFCPAGKAIGHPDMFFYGIHGIESLYTVMGTGCREVVRFSTEGTDVIVGTWNDGRIGIYRATPQGGKGGFGGTVFGKDIVEIGEFAGYRPMLVEIIKYFQTGVVPVSPEETLEIFAFMEAADISKEKGGIPVTLDSVMQDARRKKI